MQLNIPCIQYHGPMNNLLIGHARHSSSSSSDMAVKALETFNLASFCLVSWDCVVLLPEYAIPLHSLGLWQVHDLWVGHQ